MAAPAAGAGVGRLDRQVGAALQSPGADGMDEMAWQMRLIMDAARDGVTNMAVDEALLHSAADGAWAATLRLYRWDCPTLSVGYFQALAEVDAQPPAVRGLPVVRRITGGGAIAHADELTYCLVMPARAATDGPEGPATDPAGLYEWMHLAIAEGVESLAGAERLASGPPPQADGGGRGGPFWCFQRRSRHDLVVGGAKIAGSAQRRTARAVLQHGSVMLGRGVAAQPSGSLSELLGRPVSFEEVANALCGALRGRGVHLKGGELTQAEQEALPPLCRKHASPEWLARR